MSPRLSHEGSVIAGHCRRAATARNMCSAARLQLVERRKEGWRRGDNTMSSFLPCPDFLSAPYPLRLVPPPEFELDYHPAHS